MKILIVEDDTLLLRGLILAAQTEGYACDGVTTARMAEQSLEAGHYSPVVLDLGYPTKMDCIFSPVSGRKIYPAGTDPHRSRYADRQNRRAGCRCRRLSGEAFCAGRVTCPYPRPATTP